MHRARVAGKRTLVVDFNRLIKARLAELCGEGVEVRRIHSLMAQMVDRYAGRNEARRKLESGRDEQDWYDQTLPEQALELGPPFDYPHRRCGARRGSPSLDALNALLVGGLERAQVFIAGDFDHLVIYWRHANDDNGETPGSRASALPRIPAS